MPHSTPGRHRPVDDMLAVPNLLLVPVQAGNLCRTFVEHHHIRTEAGHRCRRRLGDVPPAEDTPPGLDTFEGRSEGVADSECPPDLFGEAGEVATYRGVTYQAK